VPDDADPEAPALAFADPDPETISPGESAQSAFERTAGSPHRRVVVLGDDGALLGLLCLNMAGTRFCRSD